MQHAGHHIHHDTKHPLRAAGQFMPGHGLGTHVGHDKHAGHTVSMFRVAFWFCLVLTIPTLIWEPMIQQWFGYRAPEFDGAFLIPAIFATAVFYDGGEIFIRGAYRELRDHQPGMMVLIALAITVAFVYSAMVTLGFPGHALWWELASLVTIMLLGHWLVFNLYLMVPVGILAYFMQTMGYPIAPLVIGVIFGPMADENLRRALMVSQGSFLPFFTRPVALMLLFVIVWMFVSQMPFYKRFTKSLKEKIFRKKTAESSSPS